MSTDKIGKKHLPVVTGVKCYEAVDRQGLPCMRKTCQQWIEYPQEKNCVVLTTQKGPLTLREIGKIYGLTRMRICQIEKNVYQKIKKHIL